MHEKYYEQKEECIEKGFCLVPMQKSVSGIARCNRNQTSFCSIETCPHIPNENDREFPCAKCAWVGCSIWYKYVMTRKPPKTEEEKNEGKQRLERFRDILTHTGCKHFIKKDWVK